MKKLLTVSIIISLLNSFAGDFQLAFTPQMQLKYKSQLLIERDNLTCNNQDLKVFQKQQKNIIHIFLLLVDAAKEIKRLQVDVIGSIMLKMIRNEQ